MRFFCLFIICFTLSPPRFTLFPYTTLFRSQVFKQPQIKAKNDGIVRYHDLRAVRRIEGNWVVLNKNRSESTRLNSSHDQISYAVFCLKKKKILSIFI